MNTDLATHSANKTVSKAVSELDEQSFSSIAEAIEAASNVFGGDPNVRYSNQNATQLPDVHPASADLPDNCKFHSPILFPDQYDLDIQRDHQYHRNSRWEKIERKDRNNTYPATIIQEECADRKNVLYLPVLDCDSLNDGFNLSEIQESVKSFVEDRTEYDPDDVTVWFSGSKGIHVHFPELCDYGRIVKWNRRTKAFNRDSDSVEIDTSTFGRMGQIRLPWAEHRKEPHFRKTPIEWDTKFGDLFGSEPDDLPDTLIDALDDAYPQGVRIDIGNEIPAEPISDTDASISRSNWGEDIDTEAAAELSKCDVEHCRIDRQEFAQRLAKLEKTGSKAYDLIQGCKHEIFYSENAPENWKQRCERVRRELDIDPDLQYRGRSEAECALANKLLYAADRDIDKVRWYISEVIDPPKWSEKGEDYRNDVLRRGLIYLVKSGSWWNEGQRGKGVQKETVLDVIEAFEELNDGNGVRAKEIAANPTVGVTERTVRKALGVLRDDGYLYHTGSNGGIQRWHTTDDQLLPTEDDDYMQGFNDETEVAALRAEWFERKRRSEREFMAN